MKIFWAPQALEDRHSIWDYIAAENLTAAVRMDALFGAAVGRLADHPRMGKPGLIAGTRELVVHESYRLVYEVDGETLWILALVHTSRRWPPQKQ